MENLGSSKDNNTILYAQRTRLRMQEAVKCFSFYRKRESRSRHDVFIRSKRGRGEEAKRERQRNLYRGNLAHSAVSLIRFHEAALSWLYRA
ncbi:hypothetical protein Q7C36_010221 [Tachysurus vachellii]|uniref:Uncharacterized protein n=1 Tax=Tachysurus vachellii TaxID=175792 RepID=A0AA88MUD7_TACVA|nr:hypothetical protein Q7C36_010221 [Tachysurus vachellii]